MLRRTTLALVLALSGCGNDTKYAEEAVPPTLNEMAETPGDWSRLAGAIGRTPGDSGLLTNSPITVDLNAMLGSEIDAYRAVMADAGPLVREDGVLVSRSRTGGGYLVIQPGDHAMEAGMLQRNGEWRAFRTAGSNVPRPASVREMAPG